MAVEIRDDDQFMMKVLGEITDMKTMLTVIAERAFMRKLDGGCSTPVGCNATFEDGMVRWQLLSHSGHFTVARRDG